MEKVLKAGIVGYGYMGTIRRRIIDESHRLRLVGICDSDPNVRAQIKDAKVFESVEQLLKEDLDVVFVCTANRYSPEICIESLKRGIHVFCEKPPGRTKQDIVNIQRFEQKNVTLMFGFNHRFHPGVMKAKVLMDSGKFGKILCVRGVYGKSGGNQFPDSWRNKRELSGGGILLDQGVHMIDLFVYFCGDFSDVKSFIDNSFWSFEVEDNAFVILKNSNGQMASLHSSATLWKHTFRLDLILEEGYMVIDGLLSKSGSYGREKLIIGKRQFEDETNAIGNPSEEIIYFDRDLSWNLEVDEFVRCIDTGDNVKSGSSRDALKAMDIIEKAYRDSENPLVEHRGRS